MSPATTKKKSPAETTTIPAVAEALARRQADDVAAVNRNLDAYKLAVSKAARGEELAAADADAAVVAAHTLKIKPERLDADVAAFRQALAYEKEMSDYTAKAPGRHERLQEIKKELQAVERLAKELRAEHHRLLVSGSVWVAWRQNRDQIEREYPHLFKNAESLSETDWRHIRA
jgi:hypothetical protein